MVADPEQSDTNTDREDPADDSVEVPLDPITATGDEMVAYARRRYGGVGAALAAGMLGLDIALGNKKKPESVQIQEASSDPVDVDADGIQVTIDETMSVSAPPLDWKPVLSLPKKRSRRG